MAITVHVSGAVLLNWHLLGVELLLELKIAWKFVLQFHSLLDLILSAAWIYASQISASTDGISAIFLRAHRIRIGTHGLRHDFSCDAFGCELLSSSASSSTTPIVQPLVCVNVQIDTSPALQFTCEYVYLNLYQKFTTSSNFIACRLLEIVVSSLSGCQPGFKDVTL